MGLMPAINSLLTEINVFNCLFSTIWNMFGPNGLLQYKCIFSAEKIFPEFSDIDF